MVLLDTSAWIEYLRRTGSGVNDTVREMLAEGKPMATTDVVILELLSGVGGGQKKQQK